MSDVFIFRTLFIFALVAKLLLSAPFSWEDFVALFTDEARIGHLTEPKGVPARSETNCFAM